MVAEKDILKIDKMRINFIWNFGKVIFNFFFFGFFFILFYFIGDFILFMNLG
jgi:hypothetical protein